MAQREKLTVEVFGVDGSHWTISGDGQPGEEAGREGVWLDQKHVGLITDMPAEAVWETGADQVGSTYRGVKFAARDITFPVMVLDGPDRPWQLVDSRWAKAWSFDRPSRIVVTSSSGRRTLWAQKHKGPEYAFEETSGQARGASRMLMHLRAGDPRWYSEEPTDVWRFDGTNWVGEVEVSNPTDQPMWLRWVITGPASMILPDFSFEDRDGWPGFEHRARRIVMPHQGVGVDVVVDTDPGGEQVASPGRPNYWMLMNGQFFLYPVPAWTPPTKIPVAVNPLPWLPQVWHTLAIPFDIPAEALAAMAGKLAELMADVPPETVLSWTAERLAQEIDAAVRAVLPGFVGDWVDALRAVLGTPTLGELIAQAWGSVANMAGAGVQVRMVRAWSRPYGLEG